jgi:hypothetical protein
MSQKYTKWLENIPNDHELCQQGAPKCTQIWILWFENIPSGNPGLFNAFNLQHWSQLYVLGKFFVLTPMPTVKMLKKLLVEFI